MAKINKEDFDKCNYFLFRSDCILCYYIVEQKGRVYMSKDNPFTFNFNTEKIWLIRKAIDERGAFATQGVYSATVVDEQHIRGTKKQIWMYDAVYASLDRIEDTLLYINSMELRGESIKEQRSAFDFFDFVNNMYVVIHCIKTLGHIFDVHKEEFMKIEKSTECFNEIGINGQGCDDSFFSYVRSLISVHPAETSRHPEYHGYGKIHYSPFVVWSHNLWNEESDISVHLYTSEPNADSEVLHLRIDSFEKYLQRWIDFVDIIVDAIKIFNQNKVSEYRKKKIKVPNEFERYDEYILNLKNELVAREETNIDYLLDYYAAIFNVSLSDERNNIKFERYKNAIRYSLEFLHKRLQNMDNDDVTNTGILFSHQNKQTELYIELWMPHCYGSLISQYGYELEKMYYLDDSGGYNEQYARELLENIKPIINKYVVFTNEESAFETKTLVSMALYYECLEYKNIVNMNIPNSKEFRERILAEDEWSMVISSEKCDKDSPLREYMKKV